jgi:hypothetical protein
MAVTIFLLLNGMGAFFFVYVLIRFWNEGHNPRNEDRRHGVDRTRSENASVFILQHPISHNASGSVSMTAIRSQARVVRGLRDAPRFVGEFVQMPVKTRRLSTK